MEISYGNCNLSTIRFSSLLFKSCHVSKVHEQFSSSYKSHDKEYFLISLENVMHANKEWVISLKQDVLLKFCTFNLIIVDDHVFSQRFHCVVVSIIFLFDKENLSKRASPNDFDEMKALQINLRVSFLRIDSPRWFSHETGVHGIDRST